MNERTQQIDIVFDGPPGPTPGRFVEVEDLNGASIRVGRWIDRGNGLWALRLTAVVQVPDEPKITGSAIRGEDEVQPLSVFGRLPGTPDSTTEPGNFLF